MFGTGVTLGLAEWIIDDTCLVIVSFQIHIDAAIVSSLDFITSLIASVVIFSVLGFLSEELGVEVKDVAQGGQGNQLIKL